MVKWAISLSYGPYLRRLFSKANKNRFIALGVGFIATIFMQSSTATIVMTSNMLGQGYLSVSTALGIAMGADLSSAVITRIFTLDLSWLAPLFLMTGFIVHQRAEGGGSARYLGRLTFGLGLMLLSLQLIRSATVPLRESVELINMLQALSGDFLFAISLAIILTWIIHSSLAMVIIVATMAGTGLIDVNLALMFLIGINIGAALPSVFMLGKEKALVRRLPLGNMFMRVCTAFVVLPLFYFLSDSIAALPLDPASIVILGHVSFNLLMIVMFLPLVHVLSNRLAVLLPDVQNDDDPSKPRYLQDDVLASPPVAINQAIRESLRLSDYVSDMINQIMISLQANNDKPILAVRRNDEVVDRLYEHIKMYTTALSQAELSAGEANRVKQILTYITNLEHAGDVIDKNLMAVALKRLRQGHSFSEQGMADLEAMHDLLQDSMRLSQSLFLSGDRTTAEKLRLTKKDMNVLELQATEQHYKLLQKDDKKTIGSSALHLDIIRDLKQINQHLIALAYVILQDRRSGVRQEQEELPKELRIDPGALHKDREEI